MAPCLILTGFMATGKSSIAPILARRLAWTYIDSDDVLVARAGKSIAAIFENDAGGQPKRDVFTRIDPDTYIFKSDIAPDTGAGYATEIRYHRQK